MGAETGPFHHRLTTPRDMDTHSKVTQALRKVGDAARPTEEDSRTAEDSSEEESGSEEGEEESDQEVEERKLHQRKGAVSGDEGEGKQAEEDEDEGEVSLRWKSDLATRARDAFYARQSSTANLRKLVYGQQQVGSVQGLTVYAENADRKQTKRLVENS